jgi:hypothetical protein
LDGSLGMTLQTITGMWGSALLNLSRIILHVVGNIFGTGTESIRVPLFHCSDLNMFIEWSKERHAR